MGLDISAYSGVSKLNIELDDDGDPVGEYDAHAHIGDFPEQADGVESGYYAAEDSYGFRAGSYGGYNGWRNDLAELAGYTSETSHLLPAGTPFVELVYFSDCDGTIGPITSLKLFNDFVIFDAKAKLVSDYFYQKYTQWKEAFRLASYAGFVSFH